MLILLIYTGNALYMLHLNADQEEEGTDIVDQVSGNFLIDSTLSQFNLLIGEYNTDGFVKHSDPFLCYALFVTTIIIS